MTVLVASTVLLIQTIIKWGLGFTVQALMTLEDFMKKASVF
jgi:hypothetical protein